MTVTLENKKAEFVSLTHQTQTGHSKQSLQFETTMLLQHWEGKVSNNDEDNTLGVD
jgi:hypothetical protein